MPVAELTEELTSESCYTGWLEESSVDEEKQTIRNVTLCGNESKNGYKIPPKAFKSEQNVRRLYEGKHVYLDHNMDRDGRSRNPRARSVRELAAVVESVRFINGKPRGDFRCIESDAGRTLMSLAKTKADDIGPSHVAAYEYNSDRTEVEEILEVASVDIVCFPATTRNFTEQHRGESDMADDKLTTHLESQVKDLQEKRQSLESDNKSLKEKVESLTTENAELTEKVDSLSEESKDLKLKLDEFETREALESRRAEIHKELESAKLDPKDNAKVSKVFMESLMEIEDPAKRKELIADRAAMVGESTSGGGTRTPRSTERTGDPNSGGNPGKSKRYDSERWDKDKDKIFAD